MPFEGQVSPSTTREKVSGRFSICCAGGSVGFLIRPGHRPDLSTLSSRERFRSKNNATGLGIGSEGPQGRLLIRGEPGHDIVPELYPLDDEPIIDKPGRGAFAHTDFELLLRIKGVKNLVIAGVTTDVCVSTTMREANDRGFDCVLVEDGSAASEANLHIGACESIRMEGGIFGATAKMEDVIEGVERFKQTMTANNSSATRSERVSRVSSPSISAHSPNTPNTAGQMMDPSRSTAPSAAELSAEMPISAGTLLPPYLSPSLTT
jgi:nicotinamidase-related amidase